MNSHCTWFKDQNHNGDWRWFAGCQAEKGVSSTYTGLSSVCPWCSKPVVDRAQRAAAQGDANA